jgi:prepilin-type N-terminal cleavage/methylation domain-containing protein
MKIPGLHFLPKRARTRAMTLTEVLVASAIGSIVLAATATFWMFGARSFVALGNYRDLDAKSQLALDRMTRDIRQATRVLSFQNTGNNRWLSLTNEVEGVGMRYSWDATDRTLLCEKTGQAAEAYLTECDRWDFSLFQRTPQKNQTNTFFLATNQFGVYAPNLCKLVDMTWKCSRTILGKQANTESVQTAQVVLRNKQ